MSFANKLSFIDSPFSTKVEYEAYLRGEIELPKIDALTCNDEPPSGTILDPPPSDITLTPAGRGSSRFATAPVSVFKTSTDVRIVYQLSPGQPDKAPIVWLGGGQSGKAGAANDFGGETPHLAAHPVLVFDRRGGGDGESDVYYDDMLDGGYSEVEAQARDLAALLVHLKLPPAILVGFSSGARLLGTLALTFPKLVKALVLCILTGGPLAAKQLGDVYYLRHAMVAERGGMKAVVRDPAFKKQNGQVAPYLKDLDASRFVRAMHMSAKLFDDTQDEPALGLREEALKNCTIPALLVNNWGAGRHDGMHMESVTRAVAAAMPKAEPPLVSAEMRVWFGGILGFIKKHGSV